MILFNLWLVLLGTFPLFVNAMWKMPCAGTVLRERIDPVIQPNVVSGHLHRVVGGSAIDFTMGGFTTTQAGCSSCSVKQDKSNYYVPQLFFARNTSDGARYEIAPDGPVNIIYSQIRGADEQALQKVHAFPEGLTMTAGNPWARNFTGDPMSLAITFRCPEHPHPAEVHELPQDCLSVTASVLFPSCWDGVHLTSKDFFSHMSYPDVSYYHGKCPDSHPIRLVSLRYEFNFNTSANTNSDGSWVFSHGDPTGYGFHGVFVNGWDPLVLQEAIETCKDTETGDIATTCPTLTEYTTSQCEDCKVPRRVDEPITNIARLPGCNEITTTYTLPSPHCNATDHITTPDPTYESLTDRGWAYAGCARTSPPTDAESSWRSSSMTPHACIASCATAPQRPITWAAISGPICHCYTAKPASAPVPGFLGQCDTPCPAPYQDVMCGGTVHASVYRKCEHGFCSNTPFEPFPGTDSSMAKRTDHDERPIFNTPSEDAKAAAKAAAAACTRTGNLTIALLILLSLTASLVAILTACFPRHRTAAADQDAVHRLRALLDGEVVVVRESVAEKAAV